VIGECEYKKDICLKWVFKDINWIEKLPKERLKYIGDKVKQKTKKRVYRSNMMLNPLNLRTI